MIVAVPIIIIVLYAATAGAAAVSAMTAKAHVGWLGTIINIATLPAQVLVKAGVQLAKYIAHNLAPAYATASRRFGGNLAGWGQSKSYTDAQQHRLTVALHTTAVWANTKLRSEITEQATAHSTTTTITKVKTLAPTLPQRRSAAKDNAVAFRKSFEAEFPGTLARDYPKVNWDARKWRSFIGVLPAVGGIAVPFPRVIPRTVPVPHQAELNKSNAKRLKRLEKILGITGLAGLISATFGREITRFLRCPNTRGIAKAWCGADLSTLLGLLGAVIAIEETVSLTDFAQTLLDVQDDVIDVILSGITEFKDVTV